MPSNFSPREFACHDGTPYPVEWQDRLNRLIGMLEIIRGKWNFPILIVSGYRTAAYNKRVGGAEKSQHVEGNAADIRPMRISDIGKLASRIEEMMKDGSLPMLGGYGFYPGWIHVDTREKRDGKIARWQGKGNGSEVT